MKLNENLNYAHFLPEKLDVKGKVVPEIRKRGIYEVTVYSSVLEISGYFTKPDYGQLDIPVGSVRTDGMMLSLGITDMRGIYQTIEFSWNGKSKLVNPGVKNIDLFTQGVNSSVLLDNTSGKQSFNIKLFIKGSETIEFMPMGKETSISLVSAWQSPSFNGLFLPQTRTVDEKGFTAEWMIFDYNREFPQQWKNSEWDMNVLSKSAFGVELFTPVDEYQKTTRCAKYAILFIFLTFLAFFIMIELIVKRRIHPIQYLLIGFALCMFYLLLISLSEHMPFDFAYLISAAVIVAVTLIYTNSIAQKKAVTFITGVLLAALYSFLFITLRHEDYSLLMGTIGLFVILSVIMIFTRKFDWYSISLEKK